MLTAELKNLTDWLIDGARSEPNPAKMMAQACERVVAAGLPLWRVGIFIRTLHPDIFGRRFIWKRGAEVEIGSVDFSFQDSAEFSNSPLSIVFKEGIEVRVRADDPASKRFPIVEDLRAGGRVTGGPKPFSPRDRSAFRSALDLAIVRLKRAGFAA